jgi:hypothetical protein
MGEVTTVARGWTADWLNGWLAAIGATVVVDGLRLSWTEVPRPAAVLHHDSDPAEAIYEALPTEAALQASATARSVDGLPEFDRNYPAAVFAARAAYARRVGDWSLGPASTDLVLPRKAGGDLEHGPFDVPAPQGITLHDRVVACRAEITELYAVAASMAGTPDLAQMNGLGFDARRMEPGTLAKPVLLVDPVVEVLAWHALALFPVTAVRGSARSRGWTARPTRAGAFRWSSWLPPMDRWGIDAWLDQRQATRTWESVPYEPKGSSDVTRAYASRVVGHG